MSPYIINAQSYLSIVNKPYGERQLYLFHHLYNNEALLHDSVAYCNAARRLRDIATAYKDKELYYEAELFRFSYAGNKRYNFYLPGLKSLLRHVDKEKLTQLQARVRQMLGFYYFYIKKDNNQAVQYFSQSYTYIQRLPLAQLPDKQELIYNIACVYYRVGYNDMALQYLAHARPLSNKYYVTLPINIVNTEGLIHFSEKKYVQAKQDFDKVEDLSKSLHDPNWDAIAEINLAKLALRNNHADTALSLLSRYDLKDTTLETYIRIDGLIELARCYIALGRGADADSTISYLRHVMSRSDRLGLSDMMRVMPLLAFQQKFHGNLAGALIYTDSALTLTRNYYEVATDEWEKREVQKENINRLKRKELQLRSQRHQYAIAAVCGVVILALLIIIVIIWMQRKKIQNRQKEMEMQLAMLEIRNNLEAAQKQLGTVTQELMHSNALVTSYKEELRQLELLPEEENAEVASRKQKLNELIASSINTRDSWEQFIAVFEKVYPHYIHYLSKQFTSITPSELRYLLLRRINLSPEDIAGTLGVKTDAIRLYKYRLRKKIIPSGQGDKTLEDVLNQA